MIEAVFVPFCVEEQDILGTDERMENFLQIISDDDARQELKTLFGQYNSSKDRWNIFVKYIQNKKTTVFYDIYKILVKVNRYNLALNM